MDVTSPLLSPETSFVSTAADDILQDLPELTLSQPKSPPEVEKLYSIDDMNPSDTFQHKDLYDELEWFRDLPTIEPGESKLPDVNTLFSLHSHPQNPLCSNAQPIGGDDNGNSNNDDDDDEASQHSRTVAPTDICLIPEEDPCLLDSIDHHIIKSKPVPVSAKRIRITLRMPQREPKRKPKISLRLSQPKQAQAQKAVPRRPGGNRRKRRQT